MSTIHTGFNTGYYGMNGLVEPKKGEERIKYASYLTDRIGKDNTSIEDLAIMDEIPDTVDIKDFSEAIQQAVELGKKIINDFKEGKPYTKIIRGLPGIF